MAGGAAARSSRKCVPRLACIRDENDGYPRVYSRFDWWAMVFGRIVNAMATTALTPVAYTLSSRGDQAPAGGADAASKTLDSWLNRTDFGNEDWYNYDDWLAVPVVVKGPSNLAKSGGIIAAVAVGAMASTTAAYFLLPNTWKDGKLPFFLGCLFPYLGTSIFVLTSF